MTATTYQRLTSARARCPVHACDTAQLLGQHGPQVFGVERERGCFAVLDHPSVERVLQDRDTFTQGGYATNLTKVLGHTVISMGEPEHRRYRNLILEAFRKREMERWERDYVRPTVDAALDRIAPLGRADLVRDLALEVAPRIIARAMMLPDDELPQFLAWGAAMLNFTADPEAGLDAARNVSRLALRLAAERRGGDGHDLITLLANAEIDGEQLSDEDISAFVKLLIPAGSDTTYRATCNLLFGLLTHPGQLADVRENRSLIPAAVEEALRWEPPMLMIPRQTSDSTDVAGVAIGPGALIEVGLGPANHDPRRWSDPEEFNIHREARPHVTFGLGQHTCVGSHLARLELRATLAAALDRLPNLRLDPDGGTEQLRIRGLVLRAPERLPVVFDPTNATRGVRQWAMTRT